MTEPDERLSRTARGWDEAADGYQAYFVPRFAPWVKAAVEAVAEVPDGPILVPCCGTFPELDLLAPRFPGRAIVGIDLSAEMVRLARERASRLPDVDVFQGDAAALDPRWSGSCAAVVSVFGLQQLPAPAAAISSWFGALRPGGRMCVVYWPEVAEDTGPFALLDKILEARADRSWEDGLVDALDDAVVERDELVAYSMTHPSAATYFDAADRAGPLRALALDRGDAFIAELRKQYVGQAPAGEWVHHPHARLLAVRKRRVQTDPMETVYEAAGGADGMLRLANAWHERVMADEIVSHAFSHGFRPDHSERLAAYWGEALGGPVAYSGTYGDETSVVRLHSGNGQHEEMDRRAIACFDEALADIGLADDRLRAVLHDYFAWATTGPMAQYHDSADDVPSGLGIPQWSWDGLQEAAES